MSRKKPTPQPRASKPPATVTVTAEEDDNSVMFRGIVSAVPIGADKSVVIYRSSKQFWNEADALEEAYSWCRDRGYQFTPL